MFKIVEKECEIFYHFWKGQSDVCDYYAYQSPKNNAFLILNFLKYSGAVYEIVQNGQYQFHKYNQNVKTNFMGTCFW